MRAASAVTVAITVVGLSLAGAPSSPAQAATVDTTPIPAGATWRLHDRGVDLGTTWRGTTYDDSGWEEGSAQIGYGDGDEKHLVSGHRSTYYFRRTFTVSDPAAVTALSMDAVIDDGAVVYLNGTPVWRHNISADATYETPASRYVAGSAEDEWKSAELATDALRQGTNTLAVEIHNNALSSSDMSFDLRLTQTTTSEQLTSQPVRTMCRIDNPNLREMSGLASSVLHPGILWTHNDSGDSARLFAVDSATCAIRATVTLSGATAVDYEAISVGRDPSGEPEMWVGDIGDNASARQHVKLYRFPEPAALTNQTVSVKPVEVTWSNGPRDAESLIAEPVANGRVFLVSKDADGGMYQLRGDYRATGTATTGTPVIDTRPYATDAAVSPDRSRTIIRSGDYGTLLTGLPGTTPRSVDFPAQAQGEAVTFSLDGRYVFIVSEGTSDLIRVPVTSL